MCQFIGFSMTWNVGIFLSTKSLPVYAQLQHLSVSWGTNWGPHHRYIVPRGLKGPHYAENLLLTCRKANEKFPVTSWNKYIFVVYFPGHVFPLIEIFLLILKHCHPDKFAHHPRKATVQSLT